MGCTDSLRVTSHRLRPALTVEVCAGSGCVFADPAGGSTFVQITSPPTGVSEVRAIVREGEAVISEQRQNRPVSNFRPNGAGCPPTCKVIEVQIDENGRITPGP